MKFEDMINTIQLGDCYELIKNIPDKSIDLVYVDVPYLMVSGGAGKSEISKRSAKNKMELLGVGKLYDPNKKPSENYDYIISNPPFSKKLEVLDRLYKLNKPFAMLMNIECLNYQVIGEFFLDKPLQLLIVDKKISFDGNTASFNTSYFCNKILPKDLIFTHLENNNTGDNFIGSKMKVGE